MASRIRLAGPARIAIRKVLADSERRYGTSARRRYAALIEAALRDLAEDPLRPAARRETVDGATLLTYALALSRHRVPDLPGRVQDPPHAFVYEIGADGIVDILGLIHVRMEPGRSLRRLRAATARNRMPSGEAG